MGMATYLEYADITYCDPEDVVFNDFRKSKEDFFMNRRIPKQDKPDCMKKWKKYKRMKHEN
jgi:hypothetical protein